MEKKKILFVNDEMTMGGVARILCTLLKLIDKNKYDVTLLVLHKHGELLDEIPNDVNILEGTKFFNTVDVAIKDCDISNIFSKLKLIFYMKTGLIKNKIEKERKKILVDSYDIEFSAKEGFCTIFTAFGNSKRKINWVQTDYKVNNYSSNHMKLVKNALLKIDCNIACSDQVNNSYKEVFEINNVFTIHNPIDEERIKRLSFEKCDNFSDDKINLITVARFHPQKGIDRLIKAFAKYKQYYSLTIVGDGELKNEFISLAKRLNVNEDIKWTGILANPYALIRQSDLFVMTSLYEGYPTITLEALISSTPVLSTDVAGVNEQIISSEHGYIVDNNLESIERKLDELKDKKKLLREYKQKLQNYHYNNDMIMNEIYKLF